MINSPDYSNRLAIDAKDLSSLRESAKQNSPDALKNASKQFEAMFLNMVMKSMRDATPQDGLFDNQQTKMYTSMLDQQISQSLAKRGVGLADMLVRQLSATKGVIAKDAGKDDAAAAAATDGLGAPPASTSSTSASAAPVNGKQLARIAEFQSQMRMMEFEETDPSSSELEALMFGQPKAGIGGSDPITEVANLTVEATRSRAKQAHVRAFEDKLMQHAQAASKETGIPAKFMLGQAALESGWGKHEIKTTDGTTTHNLFGIKAGASWKGKTVEATTTEYVNGVPHSVKQRFRAYDSYADAFKDYAQLLTNNPRFEKVIANARDAVGFARGLQKAGYATDPQYAAKLTHIIKKSFSV